jgi:adenylate cyclase, class 2
LPARRRNIELKARDLQPERSSSVGRSLGAIDHGLIWQRDTYFGCVRGRLKLREQRPGSAQLIQYDRPDIEQDSESRYRITEVPDAESLCASLERALGVLVVVEKRRRLLLWRSVRIHLDEVAGLGAFIEFEAVAPPDSDLSAERERVQQLRDAYDITTDQLIPSSYSDLLLRSRNA